MCFHEFFKHEFQVKFVAFTTFQLTFAFLLIENYKSWFIVSVCTIDGSWETITTFAICLWKLPRTRGWVRGVDGLQRRPKILHWKSGQRFVVTPIPHLFQPPGLAALQILRTVSGEIDLRYRRDRRVWPRIEPWRWLQKLWFTFFPLNKKEEEEKLMMLYYYWIVVPIEKRITSNVVWLWASEIVYTRKNYWV